MKKTSKKGFTLVEVMVTVALFSIVAVLCFSLIFTGIRHSRQNAERSAFQIGVNKFIAIMTAHINSGENGDIVVTANNYQVDINVNSRNDTQRYRFDSEQKQIVFSQGSGESVITPYVKDVEFSYIAEKRLLNVKVQSDFDDGWLETSFYIR